MLLAGQIYFWLPGDIVSSDWSIVVSVTHCFWGAKGFWTRFRGDTTEDS